jgi:hypothetical protein
MPIGPIPTTIKKKKKKKRKSSSNRGQKDIVFVKVGSKRKSERGGVRGKIHVPDIHVLLVFSVWDMVQKNKQ